MPYISWHLYLYWKGLQYRIYDHARMSCMDHISFYASIQQNHIQQKKIDIFCIQVLYLTISLRINSLFINK